MSRYKPSRYIHTTEVSGAGRLFFNFYTLRLLELTTREGSTADSLLREPDPPRLASGRKRLRKLLVDNGFLIPERASEIATLRRSRMLSRAAGGSLNITVIPSLACNFRCTYCYERHSTRCMNEKTRSALARLVQRNVPRDGSLSVTWFGGEPLLELACIDSLSKVFRAHCERMNARYRSDIVTNGYLLDGKTARHLHRLGITHAQVTLDGTREIHDSRRPLAGGGETFQTVLDNIKSASEILSLAVRINVDQSNRNSVPVLLRELKDHGLASRVQPYLGQTYPYNEVCAGGASACLGDADFSLLALETEWDMFSGGFGSYRIPRSRNTACIADSPRCAVITPDGGVVRCWNNAGDKDALTGHLTKPVTRAMQQREKQWFSRDPFAVECRDCILLPICMGGCPYIFFKTGKPHCHPWKHHLDESIAFYYLLKKGERQTEIGRAFSELVGAVRERAATDSPD